MSLHYFQPFPGPHSILPSCRNDSLPDRKIQFRITKASGCHLSSGSFGLNTPILSPQVSWPWYMVMCQLSCKTSPNLSVSDLPHGWIQVVHLWHKKWYSSYVLSQCIPSGCPWFHFEHLTEVVAARLPHCEVTLSPLVVKKLWGRESFDTKQLSISNPQSTHFCTPM